MKLGEVIPKYREYRQVLVDQTRSLAKQRDEAKKQFELTGDKKYEECLLMRRKCIRSFIVALLSALAVFISVLGNTGVKIVYAEENKTYEWVKVDTVYHIADDYIGKSGNYGEYYYYSYGSAMWSGYMNLEKWEQHHKKL